MAIEAYVFEHCLAEDKSKNTYTCA